MIKKSVFENELIAGMQHQLRKQASGETPDLVKAGECLHAALEILEQAGLQSRADQILKVLHKIAAVGTKNIQQLPNLQKLKEHGLTAKDLQDFGKGDHGARVKLNIALRSMGFGDQEIAHFIGKHNLVPEHELKVYQKFLGWTQNPMQADPSGVLPPGQELTFKSIAGRHRKPKRPDAIHDSSVPHNGHTKNLTPQRMIENLMNHGTVFNMADDGNL